MKITYLTPEEIIAIHKRILEETGGKERLRDPGLLFAACEKPKTTITKIELYPSIESKAATLLEALTNYHPFFDGNKRTALLATKIFLAINGKNLKTPPRQTKQFMINIASKKRSKKQIINWIKKQAN